MKVNSCSLRVLMGIILCAAALVGNSAVVQAQAVGHTATSNQAQPQGQTQTQPPAQAQAPPPQPQNLTADQLQQIVGPIALYPDALVAQILAGSAYPQQIGAADRFLQQNPTLRDAELGAAVDKQTWDPGVKALTQFPSILSNMNKNQDWTARLGQANVNQQGDVVDAIQVMRQKAMTAGNLQTTPQQTVTRQEKIIVIQPANPQVVFVPEYDPGLVYGYRVGLWAGFHPWWGVWGGVSALAWAPGADLAGAGTRGDLIGPVEDYFMAVTRMRTTEPPMRADMRMVWRQRIAPMQTEIEGRRARGAMANPARDRGIKRAHNPELTQAPQVAVRAAEPAKRFSAKIRVSMGVPYWARILRASRASGTVSTAGRPFFVIGAFTDSIALG